MVSSIWCPQFSVLKLVSLFRCPWLGNFRPFHHHISLSLRVYTAFWNWNSRTFPGIFQDFWPFSRYSLNTNFRTFPGIFRTSIEILGILIDTCFHPESVRSKYQEGKQGWIAHFDRVRASFLKCKKRTFRGLKEDQNRKIEDQNMRHCNLMI